MLRRILVLCLAVGALAAVAHAADPAGPETTTPTAKAQALLAEGRVAEARDAYAEAAKAEPENAELDHQHQLLSRVLEIEAAIEAEDPSPRWERMVCTLHAWYLREKLPQNALALDEAAHARADSTTTAGLVLETLLEMGQDEKAHAFASGLRHGQMNDANRVYKGIAGARLGKTEEVRADLERYGVPAAEDPAARYDLARLHALLGEPEPALASLKAAFETCPPKAIPTLKAMAKTHPDFRTLQGEAFQKVLETPSKVSAGCGSCGGCGEKAKGDCGDCGGCDEKKDGCCGSCPEGKECGGSCPAGEKKTAAEASGGCSGCPAAGR